ncbi:M23 family metallopeptidase [Sphingomonas sp. ac-8]|uniref:M23 family metallopeptidase n=1 Tax=Sphingomonas sp. ac-8 TaxID=3242977 RepID=UPI003A7F6DB9
MLATTSPSAQTTRLHRAASAPDHRIGGLPNRAAAIGAALAVAAAGAFAARQARPEAPPSAAASPAAPGERVDQRILNLPAADRLVPSLKALGIAPDEAEKVGSLAAEQLGAAAGEIRLQVVLVDIGGAAQLRTLVATHADGSGVTIERSGAGGLAAKPLTAHLVRQLRFVRGELDGESFYTSAVAAGVSDVLVSDFANAFRYDFDMQREVSPGDVFEAGFEQRVNDSGEPVGPATLVYAFLSTAAKTRALYRFQPVGTEEAEWFDSSGRSSRRALMRTPVEAARISSGFGMRGHPILGFVKMHRGTDFAAPTGTPIFAAGDATVSFAGPKGANGNFVRLRHDNGWETLYLHMNRIAGGIAPGARVLQGTQIGEVGTTGRSTGPHLHYEVHIDGNPVDPLSIETGGGRTIGGKAAAEFRKVRDAIDVQRANGA